MIRPLYGHTPPWAYVGRHHHAAASTVRPHWPPSPSPITSRHHYATMHPPPPLWPPTPTSCHAPSPAPTTGPHHQPPGRQAACLSMPIWFSYADETISYVQLWLILTGTLKIAVFGRYGGPLRSAVGPQCHTHALRHLSVLLSVCLVSAEANMVHMHNRS